MRVRRISAQEFSRPDPASRQAPPPCFIMISSAIDLGVTLLRKMLAARVLATTVIIPSSGARASTGHVPSLRNVTRNDGATSPTRQGLPPGVLFTPRGPSVAQRRD